MRMHRNTLWTMAVLLLCAAGGAQAHLRDYLVTYPYWTSPKGMFEVEVYNDFATTAAGEDVYVNQTELEYAVTDRLQLGVYAVSEKKGAKPMEYARTKFEGRYRLAEPGQFFVDPALYFEYKLGANGRSDEVETKILLSKDLPGLWNVAFNGVLEKEREPGSEWEKGYVLGISKALNNRLTTGIEFKGGDSGKSYIIPGAYITLGVGKRLNIGAAFGTSAKADDFQLKTLVEFEMF